jgi:two-component system probable response regulator PhcQ
MTAHKVMIVDDEDLVRNALVRSLRKEGHELITAESAKQALEILEQERIDLIISDHLMPGMTGLEFLRLVKEKYPEIIRIILTGHADLDVVISAINEGEVYRFLTKPWSAEELKLNIRLALNNLELIRQNQRLRKEVEKQAEYILALEREYPGISTVDKDRKGVIIIDEE